MLAPGPLTWDCSLSGPKLCGRRDWRPKCHVAVHRSAGDSDRGEATRKENVVGRWSKREITKLREQMTSQGRNLHDIASEIRSRTGSSMLTAYRMAAGYPSWLTGSVRRRPMR